MKRVIALLLTGILLLALAACGDEEPAEQNGGDGDSAASGVAVEVLRVEAADIATDNKVTGLVSADNESIIMIATAAKCTAVYASAGDEVQAGDILCTLDLGSTLSSYNAARINYESAVQSYNDQKTILDKQVAMAEDNWNNTKALFEIGAASQLEVDQAELNYQNAVAGRNSGLAQLEAAMQSAKSNMEQLNLALEDVDANGNVIAPQTGTLVTMSATEGSYISTSSPLAVIDGPEQMKVTASVSEALVPKIAPGTTADVYVGAVDTAFPAEIRSVEQAANMQTRLYTVTLVVPADVGGLLSGMFADVTFHTDVSADTIVVPTEAILTSGSVQYVFVVENGTAKYVEVTTGLNSTGVTEILSGLTAGQDLVVVGQAYLSDGDVVRVVSGEE